MKNRLYVSVLYGLLAALIAMPGCNLQSGPRVDLPHAIFADADKDIIKETSVVISIPVDGEYYIGKERIALGELGQKVGSLLGNRRPYEQIVYLRCNRLLMYGAVVEVIDSIRQAGIDYVGFVVEKEKGGRLPLMLEAAILKNLTEADAMSSYEPPWPRQMIIRPQDPSEAETFGEAPPPLPSAGKNVVPVVKHLPFAELPMLLIEVAREGTGFDQTLSVNHTLLPITELESYLRAVFKMSDGENYGLSPVYVRAPKDKYYEDVINVIDQIKGAGAKSIVLRIDFLDGEDPILKPPREAPREISRGIPGGLPGGVPGGVVGSGDEPPPPPPALAEPPKIIRKSGGVLAGEAIKRTEPAYPALAKAARVAGAVVVEVTIDEAGNVISSRSISGHPLLKDAAVQAARGWKFKPTLLAGQPVKVIGTLTFNFSL
jgi:TonB family protein